MALLYPSRLGFYPLGGTGTSEKLWCHVPGIVQGWMGLEQPGVVEGVPAHAGDLTGPSLGPFQLKPFCDSVSIP